MILDVDHMHYFNKITGDNPYLVISNNMSVFCNCQMHPI